MAIPDFQTLMLPLLRVAAEGEVQIGDVVERLAAKSLSKRIVLIDGPQLARLDD